MTFTSYLSDRGGRGENDRESGTLCGRGEGERVTNLRGPSGVVFVYDCGTKNMSTTLVLGLFEKKKYLTGQSS